MGDRKVQPVIINLNAAGAAVANSPKGEGRILQNIAISHSANPMSGQLPDLGSNAVEEGK